MVGLKSTSYMEFVVVQVLDINMQLNAAVQILKNRNALYRTC